MQIEFFWITKAVAIGAILGNIILIILLRPIKKWLPRILSTGISPFLVGIIFAIIMLLVMLPILFYLVDSNILK